MNHGESIADVHPFSDLDQIADADRGIDQVRRLGAARSEAQGRQRHAHRIDIAHHAGPRRRQRHLECRLRQSRRFVDGPHVAALGGDNLAEFRQGGAVRHDAREPLPGVRFIARDAAEDQHVAAERVRDLHHVGRARAAQARH